MDWTEYRWDEGSVIVLNHIDYQPDLELHIICISERLADFCLEYQR